MTTTKPIKRGPKPGPPRKATTVRYSLDLWHRFKSYCDQEGVSTGDAQNALLTWYVTERARGGKVPSLQLDQAIVAPQLTEQPPLEPIKVEDKWQEVLAFFRGLRSIEDSLLVESLQVKSVETAHDVGNAILWVDSREHGARIDERGLRGFLEMSFEHVYGLDKFKVLLQVCKKSAPPVSSPAVEVAPVVVAPPVATPAPAESLPVEIPPAPMHLPRLVEGFDDPDCLLRIYQARRGLAALGVLSEVDGQTRRLNKLISLGGVADFYETKLKLHRDTSATQPELSTAPKPETAAAPDLADKVASQLRDLHTRSIAASKDGRHAEAAKLGQEASLLVAGCEQTTLDDVARRNPAHARLWVGWVESSGKKQAQEDVYKANQQRRGR